jgi:hypothetical protein
VTYFKVILAKGDWLWGQLEESKFHTFKTFLLLYTHFPFHPKIQAKNTKRGTIMSMQTLLAMEGSDGFKLKVKK